MRVRSSGTAPPARSTVPEIPMSSSSSTGGPKGPSPCPAGLSRKSSWEMAKAAVHFVCQSCGAVYPRWSGRCENCGEWNTIVEEAARESAPKGLTGKRGRSIDLQTLAGETPAELRRASAIGEFDRVVGGGLVKGSA